MRTGESRPGVVSGAAPRISRAATTPIIAAVTGNPRGAALDLATLEEGAFETFTMGYSSGYAAGLTAGRVEAEADMAAHWSAIASRIRRMADMPTQVELADRRVS